LYFPVGTANRIALSAASRVNKEQIVVRESSAITPMTWNVGWWGGSLRGFSMPVSVLLGAGWREDETVSGRFPARRRLGYDREMDERHGPITMLMEMFRHNPK